ncbi:hypothetical protein KIPB_000906 [Kipferlia bialata]|uniref:Uncharacterized protein n=1 Tax=Kipferlia bialata TaxID=797122 RepID=A0A9K3CN80_9EUKA|nr:hypothetical protein KIPB_000906 [Kipferlia bialata]|eukprot:g906.t1
MSLGDFGDLGSHYDDFSPSGDVPNTTLTIVKEADTHQMFVQDSVGPPMPAHIEPRFGYMCPDAQPEGEDAYTSMLTVTPGPFLPPAGKMYPFLPDTEAMPCPVSHIVRSGVSVRTDTAVLRVSGIFTDAAPQGLPDIDVAGMASVKGVIVGGQCAGLGDDASIAVKGRVMKGTRTSITLGAMASVNMDGMDVGLDSDTEDEDDEEYRRMGDPTPPPRSQADTRSSSGHSSRSHSSSPPHSPEAPGLSLAGLSIPPISHGAVPAGVYASAITRVKGQTSESDTANNDKGKEWGVRSVDVGGEVLAGMCLPAVSVGARGVVDVPVPTFILPRRLRRQKCQPVALSDTLPPPALPPPMDTEEGVDVSHFAGDADTHYSTGRVGYSAFAPSVMERPSFHTRPHMGTGVASLSMASTGRSCASVSLSTPLRSVSAKLGARIHALPGLAPRHSVAARVSDPRGDTWSVGVTSGKAASSYVRGSVQWRLSDSVCMGVGAEWQAGTGSEGGSLRRVGMSLAYGSKGLLSTLE